MLGFAIMGGSCHFQSPPPPRTCQFSHLWDSADGIKPDPQLNNDEGVWAIAIGGWDWEWKKEKVWLGFPMWAPRAPSGVRAIATATLGGEKRIEMKMKMKIEKSNQQKAW